MSELLAQKYFTSYSNLIFTLLEMLAIFSGNFSHRLGVSRILVICVHFSYGFFWKVISQSEQAFEKTVKISSFLPLSLSLYYTHIISVFSDFFLLEIYMDRFVSILNGCSMLEALNYSYLHQFSLCVFPNFTSSFFNFFFLASSSNNCLHC